MTTGARVVLDLSIFAVAQPFLLKISNHKPFLQESPKIYKDLFKRELHLLCHLMGSRWFNFSGLSV